MVLGPRASTDTVYELPRSSLKRTLVRGRAPVSVRLMRTMTHADMVLRAGTTTASFRLGW